MATVPSVAPTPAAANSGSEALDFLRRFFSGTARQRARLLHKAPLDAIQAAALHHPDPSARRTCLFFLDHHANEQSMTVFSAALDDPDDVVRNAALHSLACETCKSEELCPADVVPGLVTVLERDPNPDMRIKAMTLLLRLAGRDRTAWEAVERAADDEADDVVRHAATEGLAGRFVVPKKRYERRQRRHART
jgi:HEAT repeat protein